MVKLIALDLDETLLDRYSRLSAENRACLLRAMEQGVQVVIATGRAYDTITQEMLHFPGIRYAITGNGAAVYDLETETAIYRKLLPPGAAEQVLELTGREDVNYEIFVDGSAYAQADYLQHLGDYMMDAPKQAYVRATRRPVPDIRAFLLAHRAELDSVAVIPRNLEVKARVLDQLRQMDEVYITTSALRLIEINHRDCTKASGLRFLAQKLEIPQEDTAAFGNADNDAEMLAWAGTGVSVAEGTELCRAAADYITGSYAENGVAEAFRALWGI